MRLSQFYLFLFGISSQGFPILQNTDSCNLSSWSYLLVNWSSISSLFCNISINTGSSNQYLIQCPSQDQSFNQSTIDIYFGKFFVGVGENILCIVGNLADPCPLPISTLPTVTIKRQTLPMFPLGQKSLYSKSMIPEPQAHEIYCLLLRYI